jgi:hypothetical protein
MMTNLSSHIPTLTNMATMNSITVLVLNLLNHISCGAMMLHRINNQYIGAYGPVVRFFSMKISYSLPLYQPKNCSIT